MLTFIIFGCIICVIIYRRKQNFKLFSKCNIPGPEPNFLFGNWKDAHSMSNVHFDTHITKRFGGVVGYYLGTKPIILVTDIELIKLIQFEKKELFLERPRRVPGGINPNFKRKQMLGNVPENEWRLLRQKLSPAFTPMKLKNMELLFTDCIAEFIQKLEVDSKLNDEVNFYPLFQLLTIDLIGKTAFSIKTNIQSNPNSPFMKAIEAEFRKTVNNTLVKIYLCFPELRFVINPIRIITEYLKEWFGLSETSLLWDTCLSIVKKRRECVDNVADLMKFLIDAALDDTKVQANTVLFFEAAYETLSSTMAFLIHFLVNNPECQDKLRNELLRVFGNRENIKVDQLSQLKYTEAVIYETLRIAPPQTTFIGRAAKEDIHFTLNKGDENERNITIPRNTHIQIGLWQIHHSDLWEESEKFNPSRFLEGNENASVNSIKWQAFGCGPRHCIGFRYAMFVLKLVLANIFLEYKLHPSVNTEPTLTLNFKQATCAPVNGSFAIVEKINQD